MADPCAGGKGAVAAALDRRHSVRAFRPDPVPRPVIEAVLRAAGAAPSGGNLQPWQVHVVTGATKAALEARIAARIAAGDLGGENKFPVYPQGLWEPHRSFRRETGTARFLRLGYPDRDPEGQREMVRRNMRFFGAPVGLFLTLDPRMEASQWVDLGMFAQSLMLAALDHSLGTCAQAVWTNWAAEVGAALGTQDKLIFGMALGYPDLSDPLEHVPTTRRDIASFAVFHE